MTAPGSAVSTSTPSAANSPRRNTVSLSRIVRHATAPSTLSASSRAARGASSKPSSSQNTTETGCTLRRAAATTCWSTTGRWRSRMSPDAGSISQSSVDSPVGDRMVGLGFERMELAPQAAGLDARLQERLLRTGPAHVDQAPTTALPTPTTAASSPSTASSNTTAAMPAATATAASDAHAASPQWEPRRTIGSVTAWPAAPRGRRARRRSG